MDIISVNPLDQVMPDGSRKPLGSFIAKQEPEALNNAALRFPKNDVMLREIMTNFVETVRLII
jgi:hypothetical protein